MKEVEKMNIYRSEQMLPGVWRIRDYAQPDNPVDIYLVEGSERSLVIDAGETIGDLHSYISTLTDKPITLVIAHGHGDHTAGMQSFDDVYMDFRDIPIVENGFGPKNIDWSRVKNLEDGMVFDLGGCSLEIISVPGHTPGSVVVLDKERQLLFTSDSIGSGTIWMQLEHSLPVHEYIPWIKRLEDTVVDLENLTLFVGHSFQPKHEITKQYITDTRIAAEKIVSGELKGVPSKEVPEFLPGYTVSYGQMKNFIYKPNRI